MGQLGSGQDRLFYLFNLDNHVPREHLLRGFVLSGFRFSRWRIARRICPML